MATAKQQGTISEFTKQRLRDLEVKEGALKGLNVDETKKTLWDISCERLCWSKFLKILESNPLTETDDRGDEAQCEDLTIVVRFTQKRLFELDNQYESLRSEDLCKLTIEEIEEGTKILSKVCKERIVLAEVLRFLGVTPPPSGPLLAMSDNDLKSFEGFLREKGNDSMADFVGGQIVTEKVS